MSGHYWQSSDYHACLVWSRNLNIYTIITPTSPLSLPLPSTPKLFCWGKIWFQHFLALGNCQWFVFKVSCPHSCCIVLILIILHYLMEERKKGGKTLVILIIQTLLLVNGYFFINENWEKFSSKSPQKKPWNSLHLDICFCLKIYFPVPSKELLCCCLRLEFEKIQDVK